MQFVDLAAQQERIRPAVDAAIAAVLDRGRYIMGPEVAELESRLAAAADSSHVVSCASGTDAIVMALMALGIGPGDAVYVPTFTFAATAEAVALIGATPVFVDVDDTTFNMSIDGLVAAIGATGDALRPAAVIPVDLFGLPAAAVEIGEIASAHGMTVIADAAQSFGGRLGDRPVGSLAPLTTTSFFPAKPLGCYGDGGAIFVDDPDVAATLRSIRVHGSGGDKYDNVRIGLNGRIDTMQAAILLVKLDVFADELERRQVVADRYTAALSDVVITPSVPDGLRSAWAQYTLRVERRDEVVATLAAAGVPTAVYYARPLHLQTAYRDFPRSPVGLAVSERLAGEVVSLPMHPYLSESDQAQVVEAVRSAVR